MARYFVNSLIVVGGAVVLLLLFGSMAGFALSHLRFRGSRALFLGCLAALFIPFQVIMVPLVRTMADTGLIDTYPGLILAYVAQFLPFTIYLMTSYYSAIPTDIVDAARHRRQHPLRRLPADHAAASGCPRCCRSASSTRCSAGTTCSSRC